MKNKWMQVDQGEFEIFINWKGQTITTTVEMEDFAKLYNMDVTVGALDPKSEGDPYATVYVDGKLQYLHHWIMQPEKGYVPDHREGIRLDNRRSMLRNITHAENCQNRHRANKNNKSSGHIGIYWNTKMEAWQAQIRITNDEGKRVNKHLGYFATLEDAIFARQQAERKYYPSSRAARELGIISDDEEGVV